MINQQKVKKIIDITVIFLLIISAIGCVTLMFITVPYDGVPKHLEPYLTGFMCVFFPSALLVGLRIHDM